MSSDVKNIYQRINAIMSECDYIQKEKAQQGAGVKYDTVIAMLRSLLIKHGVVTVMRQKSLERIGEVGQNQKIYQGEFEMDLVNMDDPKDLVTHTAFAHGMDGGDKAPGKAHTYAAKLIFTKAFNIETGIDEESRAEKLEKLNPAKQFLDDTRFAKALAAVKSGTYDKQVLINTYALTEAQLKEVNA